MIKKLILFFILISSLFGIEFNFKKTTLDKFELDGISSHVIYKNKEDRDIQISKLWDKFLNSKNFKFYKNDKRKLYVVYSNYKKNSFNCFIGLKIKEDIKYKMRVLPKSNYQKMVLKYKKNMNMTTIWDDIQDKKLNRNFKVDIEEYILSDLQKNSYFINIYLSMK